MQSPKENVISSAYRDLVIGFISVVFIVTIVRSLLKDAFGENYIRVLVLIFAPAMVLLFLLSFRVIAKLNVKRSILYTLFGLLFAAIISRLLSFVIPESSVRLGLSLLSSVLIVLV